MDREPVVRMSNEPEVRNNEADSRFEYAVGSAVAFAEYRREPGRITFTHTEVPESIGGSGVGGKLVRGALDYARRENLRVVPLCAFVAAFISRHPEYGDLVD